MNKSNQKFLRIVLCLVLSLFLLPAAGLTAFADDTTTDLLTDGAVTETVAKIGEQEYDTLAEAFAAVGDNERLR